MYGMCSFFCLIKTFGIFYVTLKCPISLEVHSLQKKKRKEITTDNKCLCLINQTNSNIKHVFSTINIILYGIKRYTLIEN